eukprot:XP_011675569.1 PREDICTED: uncharacterized protein LOC105443725 [Strongylocentrotus purpuratus]
MVEESVEGILGPEEEAGYLALPSNQMSQTAENAMAVAMMVNTMVGGISVPARDPQTSTSAASSAGPPIDQPVLRKLRLSMQTKLRVAEAEEQIYLEFENKKLGISFPEKEQDETLPYTPGKVVTETVVPTKSTKCKPITADRSDHGQPLTMSDDSDVVTLLKEGQQEQRRLWEVMQLPKAELTPYDGNPLEFWEFWRSFEDNIDSSSCGDRTKLTRLLYYCRGEPKRRLSPCLLMNASQGYSTAKRLLIERFGDPVVITDSWMKKITSGKQIGPRDKKGLRELADDMSVCLMSFQAMGFEQELSPQKVLLPLAERLPFHLKGKWLSRVGAIRRQERIPRFEDLMYFVQEAAQEVNDPVI